MLLVSCGSNSESTEDTNNENSMIQWEIQEESQDFSDDNQEEMSEEEIQQMFDDLMRQVENELSEDATNASSAWADQEIQEAIDEMLLIDEEGELNPGLADE